MGLAIKGNLIWDWGRTWMVHIFGQMEKYIPDLLNKDLWMEKVNYKWRILIYSCKETFREILWLDLEKWELNWDITKEIFFVD